jgi:cholesterol oxidase
LTAVPVNLGVNPALTITALAEHAMSLIPHAPSSDQKQTVASIL